MANKKNSQEALNKKLISLRKKIKKYPVVGAKYYHYKGGTYEVITLAKHSETNEDLVVYKSIEFGSIHARPLKMWFDDIIKERGIYRFSIIH